MLVADGMLDAELLASTAALPEASMIHFVVTLRICPSCGMISSVCGASFSESVMVLIVAGRISSQPKSRASLSRCSSRMERSS